MKIKISLLHILLILYYYNTNCEVLKSNIGKNFTLCFPQNINATFHDKQDTKFALYISSSSNITANGEVSFKDTQYPSIKFSVSNDDIIEIILPLSIELSSYTNVENKGIFVNSDNDIILYALSSKFQSSDAFLCFPNEFQDTSFIIFSFPNYIQNNDSSSINNRYSNLNIVGIEDSTIINIIPKCNLRNPNIKKNTEFQIKLNKGETRKIDASNLDKYDLTGTIVKSNKKISVYSSHDRASIPNGEFSKDVLIESTAPISTLGSNVIITPLFSTSNGNKTLARIIAVFDSTILFYNNKFSYLNSSEFVDIYFDSAFIVNSNYSISCETYMVSGIDISKDGDPSMAYISPIEQYQSSYKFIAIPDVKFTNQFLNITILSKYITSILLDNQKLDSNLFIKINQSDYSWAQIPLIQGKHKIIADTIFGVIIYGIGQFDSYAYIGGLKLDRIIDKVMDKNKPLILISGNCDYELVAFENKIYDSGIDTIEILSVNNIQFSIEKFSKGDKNIKVKIHFNNKNEDASILLRIKDIAGNSLDTNLFINRFALLFNSDENEKQNIIKLKSNYTKTIKVNNISNDKVLFKTKLIYNLNFSIPQSQGNSFVLNPNDSMKLELVFNSYKVGTFTDSLILYDDCDRKIVIPLSIEVDPNLLETTTPCGLNLKVNINSTFILASKNITATNLNANFKLFNILGEVVYSKEINGNLNETLPNISDGLYFYSLIKNGNIIHTGKVLIME